MTEPEPPAPPAQSGPEIKAPVRRAKPRQWPRRLRRGLLWLFVLAVIFHRPLFHSGVRLVLITVAAHEHLELDLHLSGSIFTNLTLEGIRLRPGEGAKTAVQRIDIGKLQLDYSIPMLVRKGVGEFLRSYSVDDAYLEFVAQPGKNGSKPSRSIAENLNTILAQPAAFADRVRIHNLNISITGPAGPLVIQKLDLLLDPEAAGHLRVARVEIPKLPVWENLAAETSYTSRNFFIRRLVIAPEIVFEAVNFDASQRAEGKGSVMFDGKFFGGTASLKLFGTELNKRGENLKYAYHTSVELEAAGISLKRAAAYLRLKEPPLGSLEKLTAHFRGEPEKPRTWDGDASATLQSITLGGVKFESATTRAVFEKGHALVRESEVISGPNRLVFSADVALPESVNEFDRSTVTASVNLEAPAIERLTAIMPDPLRGSGTASGRFSLNQRYFQGEVELKVSNVANKQYGMGSGSMTLKARKQLTAQPSPPLTNLDSELSGEFTALRFQTIRADSGMLKARTLGARVFVDALKLVREENDVSLTASYLIPSSRLTAAAAPLEGSFKINAPRLGAFGFSWHDEILSGAVSGHGSLSWINKSLQGGVQLDGREFALGNFKAAKLLAAIEVADDLATINKLALEIDGKNQVAAAGKLGVRAPFYFDGGAAVSLKNLSAFQPLLELLGRKESLKGDLQIDWNGRYQPDPARPGESAQTGDFTLALKDAAFGAIKLNEAQLAAIYGPGFVRSSGFKVVSGATTLTGTLEVEERKLRFKDIELQQGKLSVLTGFIIVPFDPGHLDKPIALDERIAANINAKDLDLEQLLTSFGIEPKVAGSVSANLLAGGTALEPSLNFKMAARKLKAKAAAQLEPAELDLALHYSKQDFTLNSTLRHPLIQPLTVKGHAPLDLGATIQSRKLDPELPLDFTANLPATTLNAIPKLAPAVRRIEGTASVNVHLGGTASAPALSGSALANIQSARLTAESAPVIGALKADLSFSGNTLTFKTFRGEVGGGSFNLGGTVALPTLSAPLFNLRLVSKDVLVKRDDSVTVRIDTDLKLEGPLATATAKGNVFVTNSRFFREIDILPIGLPGRPKPKPKSASVARTISFEQAPLRDWKFDIAIKTRPDDPFRIRGNLANGGAVLDLKLAGTGLHPYLEGNVRVENFTASLPFSKLNVTRGFVYFTADAPFEPSLDLQAESTLREYQVTAYVYGKAGDPQVTLTSEPPLPQADIVSLLATGTTASQLTGNPDVLAGRAAVLVFQQLYRKVFKKREPLEDISVFDRFDIDVGAIDNRTGRQEVSARFKLGDQLYLTGDLDVTGNFTGRLRYLLRFR